MKYDTIWYKMIWYDNVNDHNAPSNSDSWRLTLGHRCVSSKWKIQVSPIFRAMSRQVVGCQEDATKLLVLTFQSETTQRKCSLPGHRQQMWHCDCCKGTLVLVLHGHDSTLCLPPTSCLCCHGGPVQSSSLGRHWWCYAWPQRDYRKPRSWALMVRGGPILYPIPEHCLELCQNWNIVPLLLFHDALPWHPNNNQEWRFLHTPALRWLSGSFRWSPPIAPIDWVYLY